MSADRGSRTAAGGEPAGSRHDAPGRDSAATGGDPRSAADLERELGEAGWLDGWRDG